MDLVSTLHDTLDPAGLPVLSFPELLDRLRRSGMALTRSVVERELDRPDSGLLRLGRATGALGQLREGLRDVGKGPRSRSLPTLLGLESCLLVTGNPGVGRAACDGLRVIGRRADLRSTLGRARWSRLVVEAGALASG